jgi:hypothetical protein
MLYKLSFSTDRLEPLQFIVFAQAGALEKDPENVTVVWPCLAVT